MTDISWPCAFCNKVFNSYEELKKHMQEHKKVKKLDQKEPELEKMIGQVAKPAEIKLEYQFKGQCPDCASNVETIVLELDKKTRVTVVAWCPRCKKQLETREEAKLDYVKA